jgi:hypothetical protein
MRGGIPLSLLLVFFAPLVGGCGSKISEANYYRVHYGMTEEKVEEVLGPAHEEQFRLSSTATATQPASLKVKSWSRGGLIIYVVFENGVVIERSAAGIAAEGFKR